MEQDEILCASCAYSQTNDVGIVYCHAWHRKTDSDGYCYRRKPKEEEEG